MIKYCTNKTLTHSTFIYFIQSSGHITSRIMNKMLVRVKLFSS